MMGFIIVIHVIACIALIGLVLIQRGRGGGLVESFSGVESMFGTKTSALLTRSTTVLSIIFFISCLSLAVLSIKQSRSLMTNAKTQQVSTEPLAPMSEAQAPAASETQVTGKVSEAAELTQGTTSAVAETAVSEQQPAQEGEPQTQ
jgi:preprotein translocase subunit SecG